MEGLHQFAMAMQFIYTIQVVIILIVTIGFIIVICKTYNDGKRITFILIILFIWLCYVFNFFFHEQIHYVVQNLKAKCYLFIDDYDKAMDAYLDIQVYDEIDDKIETTYTKGVKYYYDNARFRECIDFVDKINRRYYDFQHNELWKPWRHYDFDYVLNSYKGLYNDYKIRDEKQELFDIIAEIKNRYRQHLDIILKDADFDFDDDFNDYESFNYLNDKSSVYFGKIGMSEMGLSDLKRKVGWKLLYREDNKMYLICSSVLISRHFNEDAVVESSYEKTDMYSFLNNFLYKEMFDGRENKAIIKINDEYISLLSEEIIDKMVKDDKGSYLNSLLSSVPISYLVNAKNGGSYQRFWIKSDIENRKAKYVVESSNNKPSISYTDAINSDINVLPIICVDLNVINEFAKEERHKQTEDKKQEEIKKVEKQHQIIEASKRYDNQLREKISAMKAVTEYPDTATIDDFDTLIIGNQEKGGISDNKSPIGWILLEKTDDKALLLNKYSLHTNDYYSRFEHNKFTFKDRLVYYELSHFDEFNDDELSHILETEIVLSKNDKYPENNNLDNVRTKLFFLSIDEVKKYFSDKNGILLNNKLKTICDGFSDDYSNEIGWWLRDIGDLWWTVACIDSNGELNDRGALASKRLGCRFAMWVSY